MQKENWRRFPLSGARNIFLGPRSRACCTAVLFTLVAMGAVPAKAQSDAVAARDALRDVAFDEDARVVAQLVALLPYARNTAELETAIEAWIADLDPADTVMARHRIENLLRDTPDGDLYGALVSLVASGGLGEPQSHIAFSRKRRNGCNDDETRVGNECCKNLLCRPVPGTAGKKPKIPGPMTRACRRSRTILARCWLDAAAICEAADECDPDGNPFPPNKTDSCADAARVCAQKQAQCVRLSLLVARNCI